MNKNIFYSGKVCAVTNYLHNSQIIRVKMAQNTAAKKIFGFINAAIETKPKATNTYFWY